MMSRTKSSNELPEGLLFCFSNTPVKAPQRRRSLHGILVCRLPSRSTPKKPGIIAILDRKQRFLRSRRLLPAETIGFWHSVRRTAFRLRHLKSHGQNFVIIRVVPRSTMDVFSCSRAFPSSKRNNHRLRVWSEWPSPCVPGTQF